MPVFASVPKSKDFLKIHQSSTLLLKAPLDIVQCDNKMHGAYEMREMIFLRFSWLS